MRVLILIIFLPLSLFAQNKRDYVWLFGHDNSPLPGIQAHRFDFKESPFDVSYTDNALFINHNNASISDQEGNLLFYTNGCAVANAQETVMPHGDALNAGPFLEDVWQGCQYGYPGTQNIMVLPDPGNDDGYYIIHKRREWEDLHISNKYILYSYVDMSLENGWGDVTTQNQIIFDDFDISDTTDLMSSYLSAMRHANGIDWWIIQPKTILDNKYIRFLMDDEGIHRMDDQEIGPDFHWNASAAGTAKFSPDGTKYAYYNVVDNLILFDFDRETGSLTNPQTLDVLGDLEPESFSSVEWSPNSRFIYTASGLYLHQIDTWEDNLEDGVRLIDVYDGTQNPFSNTFFLMALAPNCKIYMCSTSGNGTYHVIHNPDGLGDACDFVQNGMSLAPYTAGVGTMPNFPRFRVDETEKCDTSIISMFGELVYYTRPLDVYPNPAIDILNITIPTDQDKPLKGILSLYSISGQLVYTQNITALDQKIQIDIRSFNKGTYTLDFIPHKIRERTIWTTKVVVL